VRRRISFVQRPCRSGLLCALLVLPTCLGALNSWAQGSRDQHSEEVSSPQADAPPAVAEDRAGVARERTNSDTPPLPKLDVPGDDGKTGQREGAAQQPDAPQSDDVPGLPIRPTPIPREPANAAEMLEYFEVDESLLRQLIDHRRLHADEREAVERILFALPKLPSEYLEQWADPAPDWDAIIAAPEEFRTKLYDLQGYVTRVEKVPLIPEAAQRYEFSHYYQATVELGEDRWEATVCTRRVPLDWELGEPLNEAVSFRGMFLKLGEGPVFAAKRIAWHPNRLDDEKGITRSHVFLGDLGMDVGLWDDVRDRRSLGAGDREAFYQLLAAVERTKQYHIRARASGQFDVADVLRHPGEYHGRLLNLRGSARRCAKIIVSDPDVRARFGIDHYYEIYILVELERQIVYKDQQTGKSVTFQRFPVAVCTRQLPPGMPEGDDIHQAVDISGVFFKLWAYRSDKMASLDADQTQLCPMLVTLQPDLVEPESISPYVGMTVGGLFIVALLGVWLSVWRFGREDEQFTRETLKRQFALEEGKSLNDLGIEARAAPDFSHLSAAASEHAETHAGNAETHAGNAEPQSPQLSATARQYVAEMISQRGDPKELEMYLLEHGVDENQLDDVYADFGVSAHQLRQRHRQAQHNRRLGGVLLVVGVVLGLVSMAVAAAGGAVVVIAVGMLGYGLVMMVTGENYLASLVFQRHSFVKVSPGSESAPDSRHSARR